jgi:23S rRNA G2445 N2-methylase RlmL
MCDLAGLNKNSTVIDICCGSGSFLVTAMSKMFRDANPQETEIIRKRQWLCEAYMKTDYNKLTQDDFQKTVNDYLAYLVKAGEVYES